MFKLLEYCSLCFLLILDGLDLFQSFLKSEFSEENIEFWIACEEFKTIRTNKLASKAQKIYSEFIAINAPKQVNRFYFDLLLMKLQFLDSEKFSCN